jgi:hypothetical protein
VAAHDRVITKRRDDARPMRGGEPRQGRQIEMVVVAVRDQDGIDRWQCFECDARIVDTPRAGKAHRRDALGPDRVEQEIEPSGL